MVEEYVPQVDTSYGLIFRLNYLWARADREALAGNYNKWELTLDAIFRNLLYRNEIENDKEVKLPIEDKGIWVKIKNQIKIAKGKKFEALQTKKFIELMKAKEEYYHSIELYDIWLRKFMQGLRLYMKESSQNPSMALFGERFGKGKHRR